jgi:hypothetical protein
MLSIATERTRDDVIRTGPSHISIRNPTSIQPTFKALPPYDRSFREHCATFYQHEAGRPSTKYRAGQYWLLKACQTALVVVDDDGILDPHLLYGAADVIDVAFERKLGCVHANDDEPLLVLVRPRANVRERA